MKDMELDPEDARSLAIVFEENGFTSMSNKLNKYADDVDVQIEKSINDVKFDRTAAEDLAKDYSPRIKRMNAIDVDQIKDPEFRRELEESADSLGITGDELFNMAKDYTKPTRQGRFTGTRGAIGKDVNQPLSKPATAQTRLIEEAKKFDTFEEFIKDQRKDFHGTSQKFDTFDAKQLNTSTNTLAGEEGFWFTDSSKEAKDFAGLSGKRLAKDNVAFEAKSDDLANKLDAAEKKRDFDLVDDITSQIEKHEASLLTDKPDEFVLERFLTTDNPKVVDMKGKSSVQGELSRIIKEAKKEGHDAVVFQNISDNPLSTDVVTNQTIVFDTKSIKTKDQLKDIFNQAKSSQ